MTSIQMYKGKRGPRVTEKWEPKKWKPSYDVIVGLWATGKFTQIEIAKFLNLHKVLVCNLLNSKMAEPYIAIAREKIKNTVEKDFKTRLEALQERSLQIVERVINNDALVDSHPLSMFSKAINLLESTNQIGGKGGISNGPTSIQVGQAFIVSGEQAQRIADGLDKVQEIKRIHGKVE